MAQIQKISKPHFHLLTVALILFSVSSQTVQTPTSTDAAYYYNLCAPSTCSNFTSLTYPFTLPTPCHFAPLEAYCPNNSTYILHNPLDSDIFRVLSINFSNPSDISLYIASESLFNCGAPVSRFEYRNYGVGFKLPLQYAVGTHFNCTVPIPRNMFPDLQNASCIGCKGQDPNNTCYFVPGIFTAPNCETFYVYNLYEHFNASVLQGDFRATLQKGYEITYPMPKYCSGCQASGGRCGGRPMPVLSVNALLSESFVCFCESSVHSMNCSDGKIVDISKWIDRPGGGRSKRSKFVVAAIIISIAVIVGFVLTVKYRR